MAAIGDIDQRRDKTEKSAHITPALANKESPASDDNPPINALGPAMNARPARMTPAPSTRVCVRLSRSNTAPNSKPATVIAAG